MVDCEQGYVLPKIEDRAKIRKFAKTREKTQGTRGLSWLSINDETLRHGPYERR